MTLFRSQAAWHYSHFTLLQAMNHIKVPGCTNFRGRSENRASEFDLDTSFRKNRNPLALIVGEV